MTGLGVRGRDPSVETSIEADDILDQTEIDALYQDDALAARIVDLVAQHATRRWIKIVGVDDDDDPDNASSGGADTFASGVIDAFEDLDAQAAFTDWLRMNRKDGGAVMLIGTDEIQEAGADPLAKLAEPLDLGRVRGIKFLHPVERWAWVPGGLNYNPADEMFMKPEVYTLSTSAIAGASGYQPTYRVGSGRGSPELRAVAKAQLERAANTTERASQIEVHHSRLLVLHGIQVSQQHSRSQFGWGLSALQRCKDPLQRYRTLWKHLEHLFSRISEDVLKISGLANLMANNKEGVVQNRVALFQMMRSTLKLALVDSDNGEGLEPHAPSLAGVADLLLRCQDDIAAAAGLPLTLLFGHSPAGFSSDDEPGMRNFYDLVAMTQRRLLTKPINRLIEILQAAGKVSGAPDRWQAEFLPLVEPTEDEVSARRLQDAQTANIYSTIGAVDAQEIRDGLRADPHNPYTLADDADRVVDEPATPPPTMLGPDGKPKPGAVPPASGGPRLSGSSAIPGAPPKP